MLVTHDFIGRMFGLGFKLVCLLYIFHCMPLPLVLSFFLCILQMDASYNSIPTLKYSERRNVIKERRTLQPLFILSTIAEKGTRAIVIPSHVHILCIHKSNGVGRVEPQADFSRRLDLANARCTQYGWSRNVSNAQFHTPHTL